MVKSVVKHIFDCFFLFPNRPKFARLKGFRRFSLSCGEKTAYAPKPRALPSELHPDIRFSYSAVVVKHVVKGPCSRKLRGRGSAETPVFSKGCGISDFDRSPGALHAPKPGAIPTSLYPDIQFLPLYHGEGDNQRLFCLWSFMWSKPLLRRFRQPEENPLSPVPQGIPGFCPNSSWIRSTHTQTTCATNCATPGYEIYTSRL